MRAMTSSRSVSSALYSSVRLLSHSSPSHNDRSISTITRCLGNRSHSICSPRMPWSLGIRLAILCRQQQQKRRAKGCAKPLQHQQLGSSPPFTTRTRCRPSGSLIATTSKRSRMRSAFRSTYSIVIIQITVGPCSMAMSKKSQRRSLLWTSSAKRTGPP
ncbi:hypothetical protein IE81DRAFT_364930 [Ceraceosorus guamensis]|uniref:Uncharacterized protein n=1 Tax=Ceraceosorus guamensis TaxID=1522189 RepID=A0A316W9T4_9BASI|nr:hypothetical protein IE81DRAFT_364930 [Ceraceosorus guamensis]PWN44415.1 hypothetical protein IE81DRAFT_364930 [Ceraceosorus guamensis]